MADGNEIESKSEFLWNVHSYINEYIRFADAKAGVCVVWTAGLLGFMLSDGMHKYFMDTDSKASTLEASASLFAFALLGISFVFAIMCISPRLFISAKGETAKEWFNRICGTQVMPKGFVFWKEVLAHADAGGYADCIASTSHADLSKAVARHIHTLSSVAEKKMFWIDWGIRLATAGSICSAAALFL